MAGREVTVLKNIFTFPFFCGKIIKMPEGVISVIHIPKQNRDLRWLVVRRDVLRALGFLLWLGVWLAGALLYNHNNRHLAEHRLILGWKLAVWMGGALVIGILLFRVWRFFTDRTRHGVILASGLSRAYDNSKDPGAANAMDYDFRLNTRLKLRLANGRCVRLTFEQKNGFYAYYHEGEEILHFHGLPYPINLDEAAAHGHLCAVCGRIHQKQPTRCEACGHSLISVATLRESVEKHARGE
jgi:hypothetical protein